MNFAAALKWSFIWGGSFMLVLSGCSDGEPVTEVTVPRTTEPASYAYPAYAKTENTFDLIRGGYDQPLIEVEVGNQTFRLLLDSGSNALLVFEDRVAPDNTAIRPSTQEVTKAFSSGVRRGVVAYAPVQLGAYHDPEMRIMLIQSPDSQHDGSLTAKEADGILGVRRTDGLAQSLDDVLLDVPLSELHPTIETMELNLPETGTMTFSLGHLAHLDQVDDSLLFRAKTYSLLGTREDVVGQSFTDLQVPFLIKSRIGEHSTQELDILFDTGSVSSLKIDEETAVKLGYDTIQDRWLLNDNDTIDLILQGPDQSLQVLPSFRPDEVKVVPYSDFPITFEAVLGIDRMRHYVIGFHSVDYASGGPDGTLVMMTREDVPPLEDAPTRTLPLFTSEFPEVNTLADERFPSLDDDAELLAYQSNRTGGAGGWDLVVWERGVGERSLPGLNSPSDEGHPSLSGDGRYLTFHSDRSGNDNIYLYDLQNQELLDLGDLNSTSLDRDPVISNDGQWIAFYSDRAGGVGETDIYVYDWTSRQFISTPNLNSEASDFSPSFSANRRYLTYHLNSGRVGNTVTRDVRVYDFNAGQPVALPEFVNTTSDELNAALNPDGSILVYTSNSQSLGLGQYDRNLRVVNLQDGIELHVPTLSSDRDETAPVFSGNGRWLAFHAQRSAGAGGSDLYLFDFTQPRTCCDPFTYSSPTELAGESLWNGILHVPATLGSESLRLMVHTAQAGLVLFKDRVDHTLYTMTPDSAVLEQPGQSLRGDVVEVPQLQLGSHQATNLKALLVTSSEYEAFLGKSVLGLEGVLGLRTHATGDLAPAQALSPLPQAFGVHSYALDHTAGNQVGLTLGDPALANRLPATARMDLMTSGEGHPTQESSRQLADLQVAASFIRVLDNGTRLTASSPVLLSSALGTQLVLSNTLATELGYDNVTGLFSGQGEGVRTYLNGLESALALTPTPLNQVDVQDFETREYQALVGTGLLEDEVLLFDSVGDSGTDPQGVVSLVARADLGLTSAAPDDSRLTPLPGLNSAADERFGSISADGQLVAFQSNRSGSEDVWVYRLGSGIVDLPGVNQDNASEIFPTLSPNGRWLGFQSDREGNWNLYLYDLQEQRFADLSDLNGSSNEVHMSLSGDNARRVAFLSDRGASGELDLYLFDRSTKLFLSTPNLNQTGLAETWPRLDDSGDRIAFQAQGRADAVGGTDVYVYDRPTQRLLSLSGPANSTLEDALPSLSPEGRYLALQTPRRHPEWGLRGRDVLLYDLDAQNTLHLPGLNSDWEEGAPSLSEGAQSILFQAKRAGGLGGYDLYLYQRDQ